VVIDERQERFLRAVAAVAELRGHDLGVLEAADALDDGTLAGLEAAARALPDALDALGRTALAMRVRALVGG